MTNVHIEFYDGSGWQDVVANQSGFVNGSNTYQWPSIPAAIKTNIAKIRITDPANPETTFETAYTFKIVPKLRVDGPLPSNPAHPFKVGTLYPNLIKWTQTQGTGISTVDVLYSIDGGSSYDPTPIYSDIPVGDGVAGKDSDHP